MSYHQIYFDSVDSEPLPATLSSRSEILQKIYGATCDVLVVGGGIHGACVAYAAAFNGLRVILLEQADYAQATSSNSSKLIHGGLRYLEQFDFDQVLGGIKAREDLFKVAAHLVQPKQFLIPIKSNERFKRWKIKLGLLFYDLLVRDRNRKHRWLEDLTGTALQNSSVQLYGAYIYSDGVTEDSRLVIEHLNAARQEGALCANYVRVDSIAQSVGGIVEVGCFDTVEKKKFKLTTGVVVNCCGPWVAGLGRITPSALKDQLVLSRGSHIIFNKPYNGPCLFMPREEKGRYYFVLPHSAGTLVGTTEVAVSKAELDVLPDKTEINELLDLLAKDLPELGLTAAVAHYCFAGIRTLPIRKRTGKTSTAAISRKHIWSYSAGILTLLGGKYTDARSTAFEAVKKIFAMGSVLNKPEPLQGRILAGANDLTVIAEEFRKTAKQAAVPNEIIEQTLARRGALVRYFRFCEKPFRVLGNVVLSGDVELAIRMEQARTVTDIMRRRCCLTYYPDHGLAAIDEIAAMLVKHANVQDVEQQKLKYLEHIEQVKTLLNQK